MPVTPVAPSTIMMAFTISDSAMFCFTICSVCRAPRMAAESFMGSSSISTTSAASMAASEPMAPMATPASASAREGASLIPSPTNSTAPRSLPEISCSMCFTLSPGIRPAWNSSTPTFWAAFSAAA